MSEPVIPAAIKPTNRELLSRALAMIARRDFSQGEFSAKLISAGFEKTEVAEAAEWCLAEGFLNETRYVEGAARRLSVKFGASRVAHALRGKGVTADAIADVLPGLKENELEQARAIWLRKFREPPIDANTKAKQIRFLQSRGFTFATIKLVITGAIS